VQLGQLQEIEPELLDMGYQIIAISPDRTENLRKSVAKNKLTYKLVSDSDMNGAKAFGLAYRVPADQLEKMKEYGINIEEASGRKHGLLPVPGVFLVGTDGVIAFEYVNPDYTVRLDPGLLLAAAKAARGKTSGWSQGR